MPNYKKAFEILVNKYNISIKQKYNKYIISDELSNMYINKQEYNCIKECLEYKEKSWYMENKVDLEESEKNKTL